MGLPGLDVVFGLAATAVELFVKRPRGATGKIGDDEPATGQADGRDAKWRALVPAPLPSMDHFN